MRKWGKVKMSKNRWENYSSLRLMLTEGLAPEILEFRVKWQRKWHKNLLITQSHRNQMWLTLAQGLPERNNVNMTLFSAKITRISSKISYEQMQTQMASTTKTQADLPQLSVGNYPHLIQQWWGWPFHSVLDWVLRLTIGPVKCEPTRPTTNITSKYYLHTDFVTILT